MSRKFYRNFAASKKLFLKSKYKVKTAGPKISGQAVSIISVSSGGEFRPSSHELLFPFRGSQLLDFLGRVAATFNFDNASMFVDDVRHLLLPSGFYPNTMRGNII